MEYTARQNDDRKPGGGWAPACMDDQPERGSRGPVRGGAALAVALVCVAVALLALQSSSALALSQRGHVFGFSFGGKGEGAAKLSGPAGIAVNESTHDVYVVDSGNSRVERFNAKGEFVAAWGWGVSDGKAEYEVCVTACKAGIAGGGEAQLDAPEAIAVDSSTDPLADPSAGDVYVLSNRVATKSIVEKFSSSGAPLAPVKTENTGGLGGVAVDTGGGLWVYDSEQGVIESFTDATVNEPRTPVTLGVGCGMPGFAVGAVGEAFYMAHQQENKVESTCPEGAPSEKAPAVIAKLDAAGEPLTEALDGKNSSAVASDHSTGEQASGDVYVDNVTSVAAFNAAGSLIQRFGAEGELAKGRGVAVDPHSPAAGGGEAVYVVDAAKDKVLVFVPTPAGSPTVDALAAQNIDTTSTELRAQIDPDGAARTTSSSTGPWTVPPAQPPASLCRRRPPTSAQPSATRAQRCSCTA